MNSLRTVLYDLNMKYLPRPLLPYLRELLIKIYQRFGVIALFSIMFLIMCYFFLVAFYFLNSNWSIPFILNPHSEKVMLIRKQVMQTLSSIDVLKNKMVSTEDKIRLLKQQVLENQVFADELDLFFNQELRDKRVALNKLNNLQKKYRRFYHILSQRSASNLEGLRASSQNIEEDYQSKLLSREQYWSLKGQLWDGQNGEINLEYKLNDLDEKILQTKKDLSSLERIVKDKNQNNQKENSSADGEKNLFSYSVFLMRKQKRDLVETNKKLLTEIQSLEKQLMDGKRNLSEQELFWKFLRESPYAQAFEKNIVMGFAPYENLKNIEVGDPIYSCKFKLVWCEKTGTVGKILEGEVTQGHPFFTRDLRGKLIEMHISQVKLAENDLFHIGRAPFLGIL